MQNLSNLLCLARCGFRVHLEKDGHFYSNMSMYGRLAELNCHFSNRPSFQTKLLRSFSFCCHVCLDVVLETMPMKLYGRSHPDPKTLQRWSTLRVMDPMGVKGRRGSKVS